MKRSHAWWQERSRAYVAECARLVETEIGRDAVDAIFLCGSFASNEESIVLETDTPLLLSDVDLAVIVTSLDALRAWYPRRVELADACEAALGDVRLSGHVEIGVMLADDLRRLPARPGVVDMRKRGLVLRGNARVLETIPDYPAEQIPPREALLLVENRVMSFLGASSERPGEAGDVPYRFLYETARVYTDIATAALCLAGRYIPGYAARRDLLMRRIEAGDCPFIANLMSADLLSKIDRSTRFKLSPARDREAALDDGSRGETWMEVARDLLYFWRQAATFRLSPGADLAHPRAVGSLVGASRGHRDWKGNALAWRSFLERFSPPRRMLLAASLGADLLGASPLDLVREEGLRILDRRLSRGAVALSSAGRFGFPHEGGPWDRVAAELSMLWRELVFGRKASRA